MQIYFLDVIASPMILAPPREGIDDLDTSPFYGQHSDGLLPSYTITWGAVPDPQEGLPNDQVTLSGWAAPHEALKVRRGSDLRDGDQYCTDWPLARVLASSLPGAQRCGDEQPGRILAQFEVRDRNTRDAR